MKIYLPRLVSVYGRTTRIPFNPQTTITYSLHQTLFLTIKIFNTRGQLIKTQTPGTQPAGTHQVRWNSTNSRDLLVSGGVCFYQIIAGEFSTVRKMLLMR